MSRTDAADRWELVVPSDEAALAAEFRRHGITPGQHVHVAAIPSDQPATEQLPAFFASFDGTADLAERSSEVLRSEFPAAR